MLIPLLLETGAVDAAAEVVQTVANPWWVSLITGSGGALVVLMLWVKNLSASVKKKDKELLEISRESITCITKILERQDQDKDWKDKLEVLIHNINDHLENAKATKQSPKEP